MKNWDGNLTYGTTNVFEPATTEQVQEIIRKCDTPRILGTRHCFNCIADSDTNLVSARNLNKIRTGANCLPFLLPYFNHGMKSYLDFRSWRTSMILKASLEMSSSI